MATVTTITICNKALVLCGASPIASLTEDSTNARALNAVYDISQQDFLTENRWTFSLTRSTMATVATTTFAYLRDEEGYAYTRPANALRIWEMSDLSAIWREEGNYILSDTADLSALWTWHNTEVGIWTPKALMAFMDKLCADVAYHIINSGPKATAFLEKYYQVSLPAAIAENSQTGSHQEVIDDAWLLSKYGQDGNPARSYS